MTATDFTPVRQHNARGQAPVVLICEHASRAIPSEYAALGLDPDAQRAHVAWDIGALDVATALSDALDAPLVFGTVSRLVYDCNRPLSAKDAIPERSEIYEIPGNAGLSEADRAARHRAIHDPFHAAVFDAVEAKLARGIAPAIITVHSFTPVYNGARRNLDLGFLYDGDAGALAKAALQAEERAARYIARLNEPYDASDGVTYSLARHGTDRGLPALMIEIRNDLIDTPQSAADMAAHLARTLRGALAHTETRNEAAL